MLGGLPASAFVQVPTTSASGVSGSGAPSSASQNPAAAGNSASAAKSGAGIDTIVNCVGAQNGRISVFTGAAPPNITLCNSGIYEAAPYGTGAIGILNPNPIAALDVTGSINTSVDYQIGENTVLTIASPADNNLFLGVGSGSHNKIGKGIQNTFAGYQAGFSNGIGSDNTFSGYQAGITTSPAVATPLMDPRPASPTRLARQHLHWILERRLATRPATLTLSLGA